MTEMRSVRPMEERDIPHVVAYWCGATPAQLAAMGADPARVPDADALTATLRRTLEPGSAHAYSIWEVEGRAVGHASLKDIEPGLQGSIHLHLWVGELRGRGHGAILFCRSVVEFYERFSLRSMICEPSASNPAPNAMLRRIGFPLLFERSGRSSELSLETRLARYAIERAIAEAYLARS
jgi:RimJ/RimL family protein N-acetyltransferase